MQEWKQQIPYMEQFPIAMAYVPWQKDCTMYENLDEAYHIGTISQYSINLLPEGDVVNECNLRLS